VSNEGHTPTLASPAADRIFGIDTRSLAAFRIGLALVVLFDLATRARDLRAHYTDDGPLSRAILLALDPGTPPSLHLVAGGVWSQALLFLMAAAFAIALFVGYRTRLATAAVWLLTASLESRNPLVLHSGDEVLRLLLFWSLFVPLGAVASVDRHRDRSRTPAAERVVSAGTAVLLLQVAVVYLFAGLTKTGTDWWRDANAVENTLRLGSFVRPLGQMLLDFPALLGPLTRAVLVLELTAPVLLFFPLVTVRMLAIVTFVAFQLGLGVTITLGGFPWVMTVAMLPFLPTAVWRWAVPATRDRRSSGFGDGVSRSVAAQTTCGVLGVLMLVANLGSVGAPLPNWLTTAAHTLPTGQRWDMFSPVPARYDGWLVFPGRLLDGSEVDVFRDEPVAWTRPPLVSATYLNTRWRKYLLNLTEDRFARLRKPFLWSLCRRWNREHRGLRHLASVRGYFMLDRILPGVASGEASRIDLDEVSCRRPSAAVPGGAS
jgi:hypothetical protein